MANATTRCVMARKWLAPIAFLVSLLPLASAQTQLGKVNFPTSCSAQAQPVLEKGLAQLHSFQYMEARQAFEDAEKLDKSCALAHWGHAMAFYQQLWDFPDEKHLKEGHAEIETARKLHPQTPRE